MDSNILLTKRNVDIVFCIDGTGSMAPCIDNVKTNAKRFHMEFVSKMTDLNSEIDSMRVKVIVFRDYKDDGDEAMVESRFFELDQDQEDFEEFLAGVTANGGGDNPENGLEALYYAMQSDFTTGIKDRQVIVLFTDADALPLKERAGEGNYPSDMVDMDGFYKTWACQSQTSGSNLRERNKRLVMFAPEKTVYEELKTTMNRSFFKSVDMASGLEDIDFQEIINLIAASASN